MSDEDQDEALEGWPEQARLIEVTLETPHESVFLTVDGQEGDELGDGDRVRIHRHAETARLVRTGAPRSIFEGLRSKLHWGE